MGLRERASRIGAEMLRKRYSYFAPAPETMNENAPAISDILKLRSWKHALFTTYTLSLRAAWVVSRRKTHGWFDPTEVGIVDAAVDRIDHHPR
jgi:hypothetical protein